MRFLAVLIATAVVAVVVSAQKVHHSKRVSTTSIDRRARFIPAAFNISNVPWNQQINDFDCGAASSQMVLQYLAQTEAEFHALNQNDIMNVARTAPFDGTWSTDILRVGRFSALSTPALDWYPSPSSSHDDVGPFGFRLRPTGVAAFAYSSDSFWLDQAKPLLAASYPLIILMNWDATPDKDGHYRVLIGYDDSKQLVYFNDPWGRDQSPIQSFTYENFSIAWNYTEMMHPGAKPYWAAVFVPWTIDVSIQPSTSTDGGAGAGSYQITADVSYPSLEPFVSAAADGGDDAATTINSYVRLQLADSILLVDSQKAQIATGAMSPGDSIQVIWNVFVNSTASNESAFPMDDANDMSQWIHVSARGVIEAEADRIYCCGVDANRRTARRRSASAEEVARTRGLPAEERRRAIRRLSKSTAATSALQAGDEYYFPAYSYMDSIGGSTNTSLAQLMRSAADV